MGHLDLITHWLNFLAPAFFLAVLLSLCIRIFYKNSAVALAWYAQAAINFAVGLVVLVCGLWWWGRDGKMATYAALVLAQATSQWALMRLGTR